MKVSPTQNLMSIHYEQQSRNHITFLLRSVSTMTRD